MATFDNFTSVQHIIDTGGEEYCKPDPETGYAEPPVIRIVEYTNSFGGKCWGVVWENDGDPLRYERPTEFVQNPKLIWEHPNYKMGTVVVLRRR